MADLIGGPDLEGEDAPRIEFPCPYPVKVLGRAHDEFEAVILEVMRRHAPDLDSETVSLRDSREGRFVALTVTITATGPEQLDALHKDLLDTGMVQMVL